MSAQQMYNADDLIQRITIDPHICHGKPCIRGLRYPVEILLELLSAGMTVEEILADYEDLEREDIFAALAFATRLQAYPGADGVAVALCTNQPDIQIVARQPGGTEYRCCEQVARIGSARCHHQA